MEQSEEGEAISADIDSDPGVRLSWDGGSTLVSSTDVMLCLMINMWMDDGYVGCKVNSGRLGSNGKPIIYRRLHNVILQHADPLYPVDHINSVTNDNRRCNLRILDRASNTIRPHRIDDEEEARILRAYADGQLDIPLHEALRKRGVTK